MLNRGLMLAALAGAACSASADRLITESASNTFRKAPMIVNGADAQAMYINVETGERVFFRDEFEFRDGGAEVFSNSRVDWCDQGALDFFDYPLVVSFWYDAQEPAGTGFRTLSAVVYGDIAFESQVNQFEFGMFTQVAPDSFEGTDFDPEVVGNNLNMLFWANYIGFANSTAVPMFLFTITGLPSRGFDVDPIANPNTGTVFTPIVVDLPAGNLWEFGNRNGVLEPGSTATGLDVRVDGDWNPDINGDTILDANDLPGGDANGDGFVDDLDRNVFEVDEALAGGPTFAPPFDYIATGMGSQFDFAVEMWYDQPGVTLFDGGTGVGTAAVQSQGFIIAGPRQSEWNAFRLGAEAFESVTSNGGLAGRFFGDVDWEDVAVTAGFPVGPTIAAASGIRDRIESFQLEFPSTADNRQPLDFDGDTVADVTLGENLGGLFFGGYVQRPAGQAQQSGPALCAADPLTGLIEPTGVDWNPFAGVYFAMRCFTDVVPCPADFNGDTVPGDIFDLFDFLAALEAGLDFNNDTTGGDIFDLFDFLAALDAGCP